MFITFIKDHDYEMSHNDGTAEYKPIYIHFKKGQSADILEARAQPLIDQGIARKTKKDPSAEAHRALQQMEKARPT